jgi:hypothetical protein
VVDRLERRTLMVAANTCRSGAMALLGAIVAVRIQSLWLLYIVVFLLGTAETLFDRASFALVPALVDDGSLERVNGPCRRA